MSGVLWSDEHGQTPQKKKEIKARKEVEAQENALKAEKAELLKAQAVENEKRLSAAERDKRRKRASTLLTGGMGVTGEPQTALHQLLGV